MGRYLPTPHMEPNSANPFAWLLLSVISRMYVLAVPELPFSKPLSARAAMAAPRLLAKPNARMLWRRRNSEQRCV